MPRGDKTGPQGMGPMTGRAAGYCAGNDRPGFASDEAPGYGRGGGFGRGRGPGRGFGCGFGRGRGFGFGRGFAGNVAFNAPQVGNPLADELARLRAQVKALEERLAGSGQSD